MWFAHVTGPLGVYVRVKWLYTVDVEKCPDELGLGVSQGSTLSLSKDRIDDVIMISSIDPDLVDLLKTSEKDHICVNLYGR